MLSNVIRSDAKALSKVFSNKKFYESLDGNEKNYKAYQSAIFSEGHDYFSKEVVLPKEIIPNLVTFSAFTFSYRKDPSILPILLKYFTHKNLLKEAKGDLNKINQKLQDLMDEDIKTLRGEQEMLREEVAKLLGKEVNIKQGREAEKKSAEIAETASIIEKIKLYKENIKKLLSGEKLIFTSISQRYYSILNDELIKTMEEKLKAYVDDDAADVEKTYQSLNNKAKKIMKLNRAALFTVLVCMACFGLDIFVVFIAIFISRTLALKCLLYTNSLAIISSTIVVLTYLTHEYYERSFVKKMENFIEGPKYMDKATNAENEEELKQREKEQKVGDLIDFSDSSYASQVVTPSAPPCEEGEEKPSLYPDLKLYSLSSVPSFQQNAANVVENR